MFSAPTLAGVHVEQNVPNVPHRPLEIRRRMQRVAKPASRVQYPTAETQLVRGTFCHPTVCLGWPYQSTITGKSSFGIPRNPRRGYSGKRLLRGGPVLVFGLSRRRLGSSTSGDSGRSRIHLASGKSCRGGTATGRKDMDIVRPVGGLRGCESQGLRRLLASRMQDARRPAGTA